MVARPFRSRKPKSSPLWKCFHSHFARFTAVYPRDYQSRYGVLRGVIPEVVDKFMQCGDFAKVFARVRCDECSHEYLLAFSCKGGLVLSVMPSEEGADIWRDACGVDPGGGAVTGTRLQSHSLLDFGDHNRRRLSCVSRHFHPLHKPSRRRYFALCRVFRRCLLAQRALWSSMVVIRTPPCAKQSRLRECRKNLARQQLVAQSGVETFNDAVLPRRAWLHIQRVGSAFFTPLFHHIRDELTSIVAANIFAVSSSSTIITSCDFNLRETSSAIFSRVYSSNTTNILIGLRSAVRSKIKSTSHTSFLRVDCLRRIPDSADPILRFFLLIYGTFRPSSRQTVRSGL